MWVFSIENVQFYQFYGWLNLWICRASYKGKCRFSTACRVGTPNLHFVQGSTVSLQLIVSIKLKDIKYDVKKYKTWGQWKCRVLKIYSRLRDHKLKKYTHVYCKPKIYNRSTKVKKKKSKCNTKYSYQITREESKRRKNTAENYKNNQKTMNKVTIITYQ